MNDRDESRQRRARPGRVVRTRIAATASAAALAVGGGVAAAASPASKPRPSKNPASRIAGAERSGAEAVAAMARDDRERQRRGLARALAPQLSGDPDRVEAALAATETWIAGLYAHGPDENPAVDVGEELARRLGADERDLDEAFERMAREARERVGGPTR